MPKNRAPWTYVVYEQGSPASAFGPFAAFVELWRDKAPGAGRFPAWKDFQLEDLQPWWGKVSLLELTRAPLTARWRLWGTVMCDWWGVDYTGRAPHEIPEIEATWSDAEKPYLEHLLATRSIGFISGPLSPQNKPHRHIHGVDLPLEVGGEISHLISVYAKRAENEVFFPNLKQIWHRAPDPESPL